MNPFQKRSPPMKCKVCDCVLVPEIFQSDGYEEIRFRCIQGCRGGEYWQMRRMFPLPPSRKVANFRTYKKMKTLHMGKSWKKIRCIICGKKDEGYMSSRTLTCSKECSHRNRMNKIKASNERSKTRRREYFLKSFVVQGEP